MTVRRVVTGHDASGKAIIVSDGETPNVFRLPWYGYSLGQWPEEFQIEADRAVRSKYWTTGDVIKQRRRSDKRMNDPYLDL
jgi:hypothetical protein